MEGQETCKENDLPSFPVVPSSHASDDRHFEWYVPSSHWPSAAAVDPAPSSQASDDRHFEWYEPSSACLSEVIICTGGRGGLGHRFFPTDCVRVRIQPSFAFFFCAPAAMPGCRRCTFISKIGIVNDGRLIKEAERKALAFIPVRGRKINSTSSR